MADAVRRNLPSFRREDRYKKGKLKGMWRRPKGVHSKMRHGFRGRAPVVRAGYQSDARIRGRTQAGKHLVVVNRVADLAGIDASSTAVIIARAVGMRKRLAILDAATKASVQVLNVKDAQAYAARAEKVLQERRKKRDERAKARQSKKKEAQKAPAKKAEEAPKTEKEKKEEERAEQQKVLTQRT